MRFFHKLKVPVASLVAHFDEIRLLPVTKNWPSDAIQYCLRANLDQVGENRVQEAREKMKSLQNVKFELIGHLQRNKVKDVVGNFYRIQTIDSIKLLERVAILAKDKSVKQKILIQVNAGNDPKVWCFDGECRIFS